MPIQEMYSEILPHRSDVRWFHSEMVTDTISDPLILSAVGRDAAVVVSPGTSARVEYTLSSYADLEGGSAIWLPWGEGDVTTLTGSVVVGAVSALRLVSTGASTWQVAV